jgi:hypothetical protein
MDNFFVAALVRAGKCSRHVESAPAFQRALPFSLTGTHHKVRRKAVGRFDRRAIHSGKPALGQADGAATVQVSREELMSIVDIYGEHENLPRDDREAGDDALVGPEALHPGLDQDYFTQSADINSLTTENEANMEGDQLWDHVREEDEPPPFATVAAELTHHLRSNTVSHDHLYHLYRTLPSPRAPHLPRKQLNNLLYTLQRTPHKSTMTLSRYLSILDDMKSSFIPISLPEWNSAIYLTARSTTSKPTPADLDASLRIWREMESTHNTPGDTMTFTILFDTAVKASKFSLAEMLHQESVKRGLPMDRLSRMSLLFYAGCLRDGIAVRKAYAQLVQAGEIINTAVLTNVITGLLTSGELPAAEETFARMKEMHAAKSGATLPPSTWSDRKQLRRILNTAADRYRDDADKRRVFQDASPIAPDWRTYMVFIRYHATHSGSFDKIMELLREMDEFGVAPAQPIFYWVLFGFQKHGGIRYSPWRSQHLETVWKAFLKAHDEKRAAGSDSVDDVDADAAYSTHEPNAGKEDPILITHGLVEAAVKAFYKCVGKVRAQEVYTDIRERYEPTPRTYHLVQRILNPTHGGGEGGNWR